jgi:hypothetical protein
MLLRERQKREKTEQPPFEKFLSYRKWLEKNEPERIKEIRHWKAMGNEGEMKTMNLNKFRRRKVDLGWSR